MCLSSPFYIVNDDSKIILILFNYFKVNKRPHTDAHRYSFEGEPIPKQTSSLENYPLKHSDFRKLSNRKPAIIMRMLKKIEEKQRQDSNQPFHSETNSMAGPFQMLPAQDSPQPTSSANGARPDLSPKSQNEGSRKTEAVTRRKDDYEEEPFTQTFHRETSDTETGHDLGDNSS